MSPIWALEWISSELIWKLHLLEWRTDAVLWVKTMPSWSKNQIEGIKRILKTKVPGGWGHRDMDPNHCLKSRKCAVKKSQSFNSGQQCKDVYTEETKPKTTLPLPRKNKTGILSLCKNLFYIAIQLLDIKRLGHWAVLKVQFCPAMTVPVHNGPPVIIKNRGEDRSLLQFS